LQNAELIPIGQPTEHCNSEHLILSLWGRGFMLQIHVKTCGQALQLSGSESPTNVIDINRGLEIL